MSKYLLSSDWHVRNSNPQFRVDDYCNTIFKKIKWLVSTSNKYDIPMIVAGDIFNNIKVPIRVINCLIRILKVCRNKIYTLAGQHDMEFHSENLLSTPYQTLVETKVITPLSNDPINNIYGMNWDEDYPENLKTDKHSILVMHYTVTDGDPAFFLEDSAISSEDVLKKSPEFNFVVCGDYHQPHMKRIGNRILINCGSIGRSNKDQFKFQPQAYLLDTDTSSVKVLKIPIDPPENVFKIPEDIKLIKDEFSLHIENIIKSATNTTERPNFINTVRVILKDGKCSSRQKDIAEKFWKESMDV